MILVLVLSIYVLITCFFYVHVLSINLVVILVFTFAVLGLIYALVYLITKIEILNKFRRRIAYKAVYRLTKKIHGTTQRSIISKDEIRIIDESSAFEKICKISSFNEYVEYGNYYLIYNPTKSDIEIWPVNKNGFVKGNVSEFQVFLEQNNIFKRKSIDFN